MTVTWLEDDTFFFFWGGRLMIVARHDCIVYDLAHMLVPEETNR